MSKNDGLPTNKVAKGFPIEKKVDVIQKICPLMEESRQVFWRNIPERNENV